ncbi:MAG: type II secretion system F family protein, partial [Giesbergeria sp.]
MPAFAFEALDAQGQTRTGVLEADNAKAARGQLRAQALVPLSVAPAGEARAADGNRSSGSWFQRPVFNSTGLAIWTRQVAGLVSSGLTLERALTALADEADDERQGHLVAILRAEVNAGSPFA